jgi:hypothetical protein
VFTHATNDSFWGFGDAAGLLSVSFFNLGTGSSMANYSFDNVTTVPEPGTLALLGLGLAGRGASLRRKLNQRVDTSRIYPACVAGLAHLERRLARLRTHPG